MTKHIARQGASLSPQAKDSMDKIKSRDLFETAFIKADLQSTITMMKNIDQDHRRPMESLKK